MGYRSNVAYLIMFDEKEVYDQFRVEYKLDDQYKYCWEDEEHEALEFIEGKLAIKFSASDLKWYDSYPDVKCHRDLLNLASKYFEKYGGVSWHFVRVGEESGDIETDWAGSGLAGQYLYPQTDIVCEIY